MLMMLSTSSHSVTGSMILSSASNLTALMTILENLSEVERTSVYQILNASGHLDLICGFSRGWIPPPVNSHQNTVTIHCSDDARREGSQTIPSSPTTLRKLLLLYVAPLLLTTGIVGNVLSFAVLAKTGVHLLSSYVYLLALSIADTMVLLLGLLPLWVDALTGLYVRELTDWTCKLMTVVCLTVSDYSVWLIVALTADRYVAVCRPLRALTLCRKGKAHRLVGGMLLVLVGVNLHCLWTTEIHTANANSRRCETARDHELFALGFWPWIDASVYCFVPFAVILVLNGLIVRAVLKAGARRTALGPGGARLSFTDCHHHHHQGEQQATGNTGVESNARLTVMLLMISMTFLVTTLPMNVILIMTTLRKSLAKNQQEATRFQLARTVSELLMYANHSMNFFLYCAAGRKFRSQLVRIVCPETAQQHRDANVCGNEASSSVRTRRVKILLTELKGGKPRSVTAADQLEDQSLQSVLRTDLVSPRAYYG